MDREEEIKRISAELNALKTPEYFVSDVHGEYGAFVHILRNGCGMVRVAIDDVLGDQLEESEADALATLVYYPHRKLPMLVEAADDADLWRIHTMKNLLAVLRHVAADRSPRSVADALSSDVAREVYVILGLEDRAPAQAPELSNDPDVQIIALCQAIQHLVIGHVHMVGDIYDRGPAPHLIMDELAKLPSLDIQWGNHDMVWMGASLGQRGCIAHVVRNCARYGNLDILTDAYGMDLDPLVSFALKAYEGDPCEAFALKVNPGLSPEELDAAVKVQKAMAILQFKVEAQLIDENPSFGLESRKLLHLIDYERGIVPVDGVEYEVTDTYLPTVDREHPYELTPEEEAVMSHLEQEFMTCETLQKHMRVLLDRGSLYALSNGNLLLHACVPLNEDGSLKEVDIFGKTCSGLALYDELQEWVYRGFRAEDEETRKRGRDIMWYLWLGEGSPLFAKSKMATFEIYMCREKEARKEIKNAFYQLFDSEEPYNNIFRDFGLDPHTAHLVCGHVPVKVKDGEDPVKAGGKVICIDGGFSAAYQKTTGIAGFTLVSGPNDLVLYSHEPLPSVDDAIRDNLDIHSTARVIEEYATPRLIADTDEGLFLHAGLQKMQAS